MKKINVRMPRPEFFLILVIFTGLLLLPGNDIYQHIHQSWLYNHMIREQTFFREDPLMLSGHQPILGFGVPSFVVAGIVEFAFHKWTIKLLESLIFLGIILVSRKLFRDRNMLLFWYALILMKLLLPDSYPYLMAMFLFYLGVFFIRKNAREPTGDLIITLAGLTHPYVALINLFTIFMGRVKLFVMSLAIIALHFLVLKYVFYSGMVDFEFSLILDLALRSAVFLFPFYASSLPSALRKLISKRNAAIITAVSLLVIYPIFYVPFQMGVREGINCYYTKTYDEIPNLAGNVRIVDNCRNWIYVFPLRGISSSLSTFYQGQFYQHMWSTSEYLSYLNTTNTSYVIFCKNCTIKTKTLGETGELQILQKTFPPPPYLDLKGYTVFDVRGLTNSS